MLHFGDEQLRGEQEAGEEAGIPEEIARRAKSVGVCSYRGVDEWDQLKNDVLFCYDLELPWDFEPVAVDGEVEGFESQCATGQSCPGFAAAFKAYAEAHERATVGAAPAEGMAHARLLVVNDHWRNVGMGFMPTHVANTLVLAMATGIYIYFDNYGRYDWSRYFYGQYGLDLRWTPARRRL